MPPSRIREMPIVRIVARALVPVILLFGLYVQFHGDYGPGGGFQAGVIFAAGLFIFGLTFGADVVRKVVSVALTERLMAGGVLLYGAVGVTAMLMGGEFLNYSALDPLTTGHYGQHLGIIGIELGIGIAVAATMMRIYYAVVDHGVADRAAEAGAGAPGAAADQGRAGGRASS